GANRPHQNSPQQHRVLSPGSSLVPTLDYTTGMTISTLFGCQSVKPAWTFENGVQTRGSKIFTHMIVNVDSRANPTHTRGRRRCRRVPPGRESHMKVQLLATASAAALFALPVSALAQTSEADSPAETTAQNAPRGGNDIIVTATRRTARLQDVPLSVTAFGQE